MPELTSAERFDLWMQFLQRWPIDKLKKMTLREYNAIGDKDSFCSWLENRTEPLGSIWGGSSFKFGIFEFDQTAENANKDSAGVSRDEKYKWATKYGTSADDAFEKIKSIIVSIAEASSAGDYVAIDTADLGHATKWKIAFLYQDHENPKLVAIYKREWLEKYIGCNDKNTPTSALFARIGEQRPMHREEVFSFSKDIGDDLNGMPFSPEVQFFVCSVGDPREDYTDDNLIRCVEQNAHVMHESTRSDRKGDFNLVRDNDIIFLKYNQKIIAWGKVVGKVAPGDGSEDGWNNKIFVQQWIFYSGDHRSGVGYYGINNACVNATINYDVVRQVQSSWAVAKLKEFPNSSDIMKIYNGEISMSHIQQEIQELVEEKLQVILTGAPGTGKTYLAQEVAAKMILGTSIGSADRIEEALEKAGKRGQYQFVQFHPGYDYSDFVEGIKPRVDKNSKAPEFGLEEGIFKKFCAAAAAAFDSAPDKKTASKFVMVIDEINRADLSRVFGELFFGLEKDYRGKEIRTQYDYLKRVPGSDAFKEGFSRFVIPPNLYIIGTMNDIDRSVESMDFALRRRFGWREISWQESLAIIDAKIPTASNPELNNAAKKIMAAVNNVIITEKMELESAFALGGAYFKDAAEKSWDDLWRHSIRIILNEYLRGNRCDKSIEDIEKIWKQEVNKVAPGTYELSVTDNAD